MLYCQDMGWIRLTANYLLLCKASYVFFHLSDIQLFNNIHQTKYPEHPTPPTIKHGEIVAVIHILVHLMLDLI